MKDYLKKLIILIVRFFLNVCENEVLYCAIVCETSLSRGDNQVHLGRKNLRFSLCVRGKRKIRIKLTYLAGRKLKLSLFYSFTISRSIARLILYLRQNRE